MKVLGLIILSVFVSNPGASAADKNKVICQQTADWVFPLKKYKLVSRYGKRSGAMHTGVDLKAKLGAPILAVQDGKVLRAEESGGYGKFVVLEHEDGLRTRYAHNSENLVEVGETVDQGDEIARVGQTGNATTAHLHFEIRRGRRHLNPMIVFEKCQR